MVHAVGYISVGLLLGYIEEKKIIVQLGQVNLGLTL
jgi:hypothetical protein